MFFLLITVPLAVVLLEYVAVSSALAYARFIAEYDQPVISLLGGIVRIGRNLPYDAVPNAVIVLHLLALFLSVMYFAYFCLFNPKSDKNIAAVSPPEG